VEAGTRSLETIAHLSGEWRNQPQERTEVVITYMAVITPAAEPLAIESAADPIHKLRCRTLQKQNFTLDAGNGAQRTSVFPRYDKRTGPLH
jgi:hypothetical protein